MSNYFFKVLRSGINTTFQDKGRFHMQHLGVTPGGWNIIGRTPIKLFNTKNESNPCLLSPGDSVKFESISKKEFEKLLNE